MLNCQNCDAPAAPSAQRCENCGAKLLHPRVIFGAPRREDFSLTAEEALDSAPSADESWEFSHPAFAAREVELVPEPARARVHGGFFRRAVAFVLDLFVIALLSAIMGLLAYVGYKVGLAAHQREISGSTMGPLLTLLTGAGTFLSIAYFVLFHGLEGRTPGKWLLRLRVVGADNEPIGYRRACLRWIAMVVFAPVLLGLFWVLWSREKRAWHDYLAGTWVVVD